MCEEQKETESEDFDTLRRDGMTISRGDGFSVCTFMIAGHIEGHTAVAPPLKSTKYEHIIPRLIDAERSPGIDGVLVILNTVGGDVEAGLAMAELISSMRKPVVSLIIGGGHSIGIPLAVSAKKSFIVRSATMTLHPVRTNGLIIGVSQTFTYFQKMQERITSFIVSHSDVKKEELEELIYASDFLAGDIGTVIDGKKAVEIGLIDSLGGLSEALDALKEIKDR